MASFEGPDPCASTPMVSMAALKPSADVALLEEVLRFQGTLRPVLLEGQGLLLLLLLLSGLRALLLLVGTLEEVFLRR